MFLTLVCCGSISAKWLERFEISLSLSFSLSLSLSLSLCISLSEREGGEEELTMLSSFEN